MDYKGLKCSVCGKTFTADDDIVVCPQCGAPYHRECYAKVGKCVYADKHGTPDAWQPPKDSQEAQDEAQPQIKRCPRCGAPNAMGSLFCVHCGQPLSENDNPYGHPFPQQDKPPENNPNGTPQNGFPPQDGNMPPDFDFNGMPYFMDPLGGVKPGEPIGNAPAGDLAKFVQGNTPYYIPTFVNISHYGRSRFNFSAFFFQGIWMLYRKLYKIGAFITALQGVLLIGYSYIMRYYCIPLYQKLLNAIGVTNTMSAYALTPEQKSDLMHQYYVLPMQQQVLLVLPALLLLMGFAVMLICGFTGNRLYLKHCLSSVNRIHSETSEPVEFSIRLQKEGGVNSSLGVVFLLCFLLIFFLFVP